MGKRPDIKEDYGRFSTSEKEQKGKDFGGGGRECVWLLKGTSQLRGIEAAAVDFPREMMWHLFFVLSFNFGAGGRH